MFVVGGRGNLGSKKKGMFSAYINPLQFQEVDIPSTFSKLPSAEEIIKFCCPINTDSSIPALVDRYKSINAEKRRLFAAPMEPRILDKIIWPLRSAKSACMLGNYIGCISLCGMVAEMLAMLIYEISDFFVNGKLMTTEQEKSVFGCKFEKLGQDRRIKVLNAYKIIDGELKNKFDLIRNTRKKYLHLWSHDHDCLYADAIKLYSVSVEIAVHIIGQDIHDGKISLNPRLIEYLKKNGIFEAELSSKAEDKICYRT